MKIPAEILEKWKELKEYGDVVELAKQTGKSQPVISLAFSGGECSEEVFATMSDFYKARAERREQLINAAS